MDSCSGVKGDAGFGPFWTVIPVQSGQINLRIIFGLEINEQGSGISLTGSPTTVEVSID